MGCCGQFNGSVSDSCCDWGNDCCQFNSAGASPPVQLYNSAILSWTANGPGTGSGTEAFLTAAGNNAAPGLITAVPGVWVPTDDGFIDMLFIHQGNLGVTSFLMDYTLNVNEVDTALTASIAANQEQQSNTADVVSVFRGDRVRMKVRNNGSTNTNLRPTVVCRYRVPV